MTQATHQPSNGRRLAGFFDPQGEIGRFFHPAVIAPELLRFGAFAIATLLMRFNSAYLAEHGSSLLFGARPEHFDLILLGTFLLSMLVGARKSLLPVTLTLVVAIGLHWAGQLGAGAVTYIAGMVCFGVFMISPRD